MPQEEIPPLEAILDGSGVKYYSKRKRQLTALEKKLEVARQAFYADRKQHGLPGPPRIHPASGSAPSRTMVAAAAVGPRVSTAVLRREIRRKAYEEENGPGGPSTAAAVAATSSAASTSGNGSGAVGSGAGAAAAGAVSPTSSGGVGGAAAAAATVAAATTVGMPGPSLSRSISLIGGGASVGGGGFGPTTSTTTITATSMSTATHAANASTTTAGGGSGGGASSTGTAGGSSGADAEGAYRRYGDPLAVGSGRGPVVAPQPYHTDARTFFHLSLLPTSVERLSAESALYYMPAGARKASAGRQGTGLRDGMIRYYQPDLKVEREEQQRTAHLRMAERLAKAQEALGEHIESIVARWGPDFLDRLVTAAEAEAHGGGGGLGNSHGHKLSLTAGGVDVPSWRADGPAAYMRRGAGGAHRHTSPAAHGAGGGGGSGVAAAAAGGGGGGPASGQRAPHGPISASMLEKLTLIAQILQVPVGTIVNLMKKPVKKAAKPTSAVGAAKSALKGGSGGGGRVVGVAGARQGRRIELQLSRKGSPQPQGQARGDREEEEDSEDEGEGEDEDEEEDGESSSLGAGDPSADGGVQRGDETGPEAAAGPGAAAAEARSAVSSRGGEVGRMSVTGGAGRASMAGMGAGSRLSTPGRTSLESRGGGGGGGGGGAGEGASAQDRALLVGQDRTSLELPADWQKRTHLVVAAAANSVEVFEEVTTTYETEDGSPAVAGAGVGPLSRLASGSALGPTPSARSLRGIGSVSVVSRIAESLVGMGLATSAAPTTAPSVSDPLSSPLSYHISTEAGEQAAEVMPEPTVAHGLSGFSGGGGGDASSVADRRVSSAGGLNAEGSGFAVSGRSPRERSQAGGVTSSAAAEGSAGDGGAATTATAAAAAAAAATLQRPRIGASGFLSRRSRAGSAAASRPLVPPPQDAAAAAAAGVEAPTVGSGAAVLFQHPAGVSFVDLGRVMPAGPSHEGLQPADPRAQELEAASRAALETLARRHGDSHKVLTPNKDPATPSPRGGGGGGSVMVTTDRSGSVSPPSRPGTSGGDRSSRGRGAVGPSSQRHRSRPGSRSLSTRAGGGGGGGGPRRPSQQEGHERPSRGSDRRRSTATGAAGGSATGEDWDVTHGLHFSDGSEDGGAEGEDGNDVAAGPVGRRRHGSKEERLGSAGPGGAASSRSRTRSNLRERPREPSPPQTVVIVTITTASGETSPVIRRTVASGSGAAGVRGGSRQSQRRAGAMAVASPLPLVAAAVAAADNADGVAEDPNLQRLAGAVGMKVGGGGGRRRRTSTPRSTTSSKSLAALIPSSSSSSDDEFVKTGVGAGGRDRVDFADSPRIYDALSSPRPTSPAAGAEAAAAAPASRLPILAWDGGGPINDGSRPVSSALASEAAETPVAFGGGATATVSAPWSGPSPEAKPPDAAAQGLSRHYKVAGTRWNPAAPGALRPGYGAEFDYTAGTYNPLLMERVAAARDVAALTGEEMRVEYVSPVRAVSPGHQLAAGLPAPSRPPRHTPLEGAKRDAGGGPAASADVAEQGATAVAMSTAPAASSHNVVGSPPELSLLTPAGRAAAAKARTAAAIADVLNPVSRAIVHATTLTSGGGAGGTAALPPALQVLAHVRATDGGGGPAGHVTFHLPAAGPGGVPLASSHHATQSSTAAATAAVVRHLIPMLPHRTGSGGSTTAAAAAAATAGGPLDSVRGGTRAAAAGSSTGRSTGAADADALERYGTMRPSQSVWGRTDLDERDILQPLNQHLVATARAASAAKAAHSLIPAAYTGLHAGGGSTAAATHTTAAVGSAHSKAPAGSWPASDWPSSSSALASVLSGRRAMTAPAGPRPATSPQAAAAAPPPPPPGTAPRLWRGDVSQLTSAFPKGEKTFRLITDVQSSARLLRDMEKDITPVEYRKRLRRGVVL